MTPGTADALTPADRARLVGILGRLGSDFDGERAAAGLLASNLLRDRGLTWAELLDRPAPTPPPPPGNWSRRAAWCAEGAALLSPWESRFLDTLAARVKPPTEKQAAVLDRLVARRMAAGGGQ